MVWRLGIAVLVILVINLALSLGFGTFLLGRPIRRLVAKARAVGGGDFETPLNLGGRDELAELGDEINQMSAKLAIARDELQAEHQGHLAAENQLRHAERLATVGKLAAGIAHEIGTPLNVADAHSKMIVAGQVQGAEVANSARTICRQTKRITEMIQRLMRFARRKEPRKEPVEVLQLVLDTVRLLESFEKKSGVTLAVDRGSPVKTLADGDQLQQVLTNLIINGIHATPKGGQISIHVSIKNVSPPDLRGGPGQDYCCITVEDHGAGIAAANLPHVFDPFFTTKEVNEGTGLGLSVAHAIVRDHDGWIAVESEVDRGSCFEVYLPMSVS